MIIIYESIIIDVNFLGGVKAYRRRNIKTPNAMLEMMPWESDMNKLDSQRKEPDHRLGPQNVC